MLQSAKTTIKNKEVSITTSNIDTFELREATDHNQEAEPNQSGIQTEAQNNSVASTQTVGRVRREARTNLFQTQRSVLDPEEALLEFFRAHPRPHSLRDLYKDLPESLIERLDGRKGLELALERLLHHGQLSSVRRQTYALATGQNLTIGLIEFSKGVGVVLPDTPGLEALTILPEDTFNAWHGDRVVARKKRGAAGEHAGEVIRILDRSRQRLVGTLEYRRGYAMLRPDWVRLPRLVLLPKGTEQLSAGARLVVKPHWPEISGEDEPYGEIIEVLGNTDNPIAETHAVIRKFELPEEFPQVVQEEAEKISLRIPESALAGRTDLRSKRVFTIDGQDAKDFDDAIHIEPLKSGHYLVGIHVADVSHFVTEGSKLDEEAKARATSVYLPGKVIPMLPERLSNGVCSLVPNEDRLTVSTLVELTPDGSVVNYALTNSVIRSKARLSYENVQAYSERRGNLGDTGIEEDVTLLLELTRKMRERRMREGSLDFKLRETKVEIADTSINLIPVREERARGLIEDMMLLANKIVAAHLQAKGAPTLFRVHEEPSDSRFKEVMAALMRMGVDVPSDEPSPEVYQRILESVRGTPHEAAVNTLLLRSMKQAKYSNKNLGHFGLAFGDYLHFTSPIRRYPDLLTHRVLKWLMAEKLSQRKKEILEANLPGLAAHTSKLERNASEAERDLNKYFHCKWAQARVGQSFKGWVSGMTERGLFLAIENGVEGFLPFTGLDDDEYSFMPEMQMAKGRLTGRHFRLGTGLSVRISHVDAIARHIDFEIKEKTMTKIRQRQQGVSYRQEGNRRVIVLNARPKGEHSKPVKVTARRLYFGEWTRANLETEDGNENQRRNQNNNQTNHQMAQQRIQHNHSQHGQAAKNQSQQNSGQQSSNGQRNNGQHNASPRNASPRNAGPQNGQTVHQGQRPPQRHIPQKSNSNPNQNQQTTQTPNTQQANSQQRRPNNQANNPRASAVVNPRHAPNPEILSRNAARAMRGPAEGGNAAKANQSHSQPGRPAQPARVAAPSKTPSNDNKNAHAKTTSTTQASNSASSTPRPRRRPVR